MGSHSYKKTTNIRRTFGINEKYPAELLAFLITVVSATESAETTSLQTAVQLNIKHHTHKADEYK